MQREINLLPKPEQRVRLRGLYLAQLGRFGRRIYFGLAVIVVAQVGVWSAFASLLDQEMGRASDTAELGQDVQREVSEINDLISAFDSDLREQVVWTSLVRDLLVAVPVLITIESLSVEDDLNIIELKGSASSRSAVVSLQEDLEQLDWVERVEAPLQNFTVGVDEAFSLQLHMTEAQ